MAHLYIEGLNGQVEVDEQWVRINRKGVVARMGRGAGNVFREVDHPKHD